MDELCEARSELLCRLEKEQNTILHRLRNIRTEIKACRAKIDLLVKESPPAIKRLPVELLLRIFALCIADPTSVGSMQQLAGVSCFWRDLILNTPRFWTSIQVSPYRSLSFLRIQLKRSRQAPLRIRIQEWLTLSYKFALESLAVIIRATSRWSTLLISGNSVEFTQVLVSLLRREEFPSLEKVHFVHNDHERSVIYPDFLTPKSAPILEDLSTRGLISLDKFAMLPKLKVMRLRSFSEPFPTLLASHLLVSLALYGDTGHWRLERDSINFPLLEKLFLRVTDSAHIMSAIVAPKLDRFEFVYSGQPVFHTFGGLGDKFSHVRTVVYTASVDRIHDTSPFCRAFPNVRHAKIYAEPNVFFTALPYPSNNPFSFPISHWKNLESLAICNIPGDWYKLWDMRPEGDNPLVTWLRWRHQSDQPLLCVKLTEFSADEMSGHEDLFSRLYDTLQRYCNLELDNIPFLNLRLMKSMGSALKLVSCRVHETLM